jgi:hypothetical protein
MGDFFWTMAKCFVFTITVETLVLLAGLSKRHSISRRFAAGVWLSACTYPLLWMVLPVFLPPERNLALYLAVGESFVPVAECALFWQVFQRGRDFNHSELWRDWTVIFIANLASFGLGELVWSFGGLFVSMRDVTNCEGYI